MNPEFNASYPLPGSLPASHSITMSVLRFRGPNLPVCPMSFAGPAAPPLGPSLQLPPNPDPSAGDPVHSELSDAAASSSSSSCPPCSPDPSRETPGLEPAEGAVGSGVNGEGRSEKGRLYCPTCKVTVNSASQLQAHNTGQCFLGAMSFMAR